MGQTCSAVPEMMVPDALLEEVEITLPPLLPGPSESFLCSAAALCIEGLGDSPFPLLGLCFLIYEGEIIFAPKPLASSESVRSFSFLGEGRDRSWNHLSAPQGGRLGKEREGGGRWEKLRRIPVP